jgi:hypothetical protein
MQIFNTAEYIEKVAQVPTAPAGFRYGYIPNIFPEAVYQKLIATFPDIKNFEQVDKMSGGGRKHFFVGPLYSVTRNWGSLRHMSSIDSLWLSVMREAAGKEFIASLSRATGIPFNTMCTFGFTYGREGSVQEPHLDGAVRSGDTTAIKGTIACLMYFNPDHGNIGATEVYDTDGKTLLFKAPDMRNGLLFFEQHKDAWHGYPALPKGYERFLVSLAYANTRRSIPVSTSFIYSFIPIQKFVWRLSRIFS